MQHSKSAVEPGIRHPLDSVTDQRITGRFMKQTWGGRKGDDAVPCGHEDFDATDHILLMSPDDVRALQDGSDNTDEIGSAHVSWDGPHDVMIADSIRMFFGVESLEEITDDAFAAAKQRLNPQPATEHTVTLTLKVKVRVAAGSAVSDFIEELDYSVTSNTSGITVLDTEIADSN